MCAQILSFTRRPAASRDWLTKELAEFYRVESALIQSGLRVVSARGLTDEGEPWFVFCRAEDDEVVIHFARIDGRYVISAPTYCGNAEGNDFGVLVRSMIDRHPVLRPQPGGNNLFLHPAALLVVLVASALLKSGHAAEAAPIRNVADGADTKDRGFASSDGAAATPSVSFVASLQQETMLLAAVAAAVASPTYVEQVAVAVSASLGIPSVADQAHERFASTPVTDDARNSLSPVFGGSMPTTTVLQLINPASADATPYMSTHTEIVGTSSHTGFPADGGGGAASVAGPVVAGTEHPNPLAESASPMPVVALVNPASGAQHVALSTVTTIPQADMDFLNTEAVGNYVAYLNAVPVVFSTVLASGFHTVTSHPDEAPASHSDVTTHAVSSSSASPAVTESSTTSAAPSTAVAAPSTAVAAPSTAVAAPSTVAAPEPAVAAPETSSATTTVATSAPVAAAVPLLSDVLVVVEKFQAVEIQPNILITDHSAIFYDAHAIETNLLAVRSVTYDFGDGFSISLVGLPAELLHAGAHV